jgi:hypothetical protein
MRIFFWTSSMKSTASARTREPRQRPEARLTGTGNRYQLEAAERQIDLSTISI